MHGILRNWYQLGYAASLVAEHLASFHCFLSPCIHSPLRYRAALILLHAGHLSSAHIRWPRLASKVAVGKPRASWWLPAWCWPLPSFHQAQHLTLYFINTCLLSVTRILILVLLFLGRWGPHLLGLALHSSPPSFRQPWQSSDSIKTAGCYIGILLRLLSGAERGFWHLQSLPPGCLLQD